MISISIGLFHLYHSKRLYIYASPDLYNELVKYIGNELSEGNKVRTKNSLVKYLSRMSTRCAPFGLFATCAMGELSNETKIVLEDKVIAHVRFDMLYLCNLSQKLMGIAEIKQSVKYFINSTIYHRGKKIRYIEYKFDTQKRVYRLAEITSNNYLKAILKKAKGGAYIKELVSLLTTLDEDISEEMADSYINSLVNNQIIVSEIDPIITGNDFFDHIITVLKNAIPQSEIYNNLNKISKFLGKLNEEKRSEDITVTCSQIEDIIKTINVPYNKRFLLQVDSIREMQEASLDSNIVTSLQDCMTFLNKLYTQNGNGNLKIFKENFRKRYEEQEIPLMEVLDTELGIGYLTNQVNDLSPLIAAGLLSSK